MQINFFGEYLNTRIFEHDRHQNSDEYLHTQYNTCLNENANANHGYITRSSKASLEITRRFSTNSFIFRVRFVHLCFLFCEHYESRGFCLVIPVLIGCSFDREKTPASSRGHTRLAKSCECEAPAFAGEGVLLLAHGHLQAVFSHRDGGSSNIRVKCVAAARLGMANDIEPEVEFTVIISFVNKSPSKDRER